MDRALRLPPFEFGVKGNGDYVNPSPEVKLRYRAVSIVSNFALKHFE
jgi:hypothetical protein